MWLELLVQLPPCLKPRKFWELGGPRAAPCPCRSEQARSTPVPRIASPLSSSLCCQLVIGSSTLVSTCCSIQAVVRLNFPKLLRIVRLHWDQGMLSVRSLKSLSPLNIGSVPISSASTLAIFPPSAGRPQQPDEQVVPQPTLSPSVSDGSPTQSIVLRQELTVSSLGGTDNEGRNNKHLMCRSTLAQHTQC